MVSFKLAVKLFYTQFLKFSGRSTLSEFWWPVLFSMAVGAVLSFADGVFFNGSQNYLGFVNEIEPNIGTLPILSSIWNVINFIPLLAVTVRRLHDANKSAIWMWGYVLAPLTVIPAAALLSLLVWVYFIFLVLGMFAWSIVLIVLLCLPSSPGGNMYGSPSKYSSNPVYSGSQPQAQYGNPYGRVAYPPAQFPTQLNSGYVPGAQQQYQPPVQPQQPVYPAQLTGEGHYSNSEPQSVVQPPVPPSGDSYTPKPKSGYIPYNPPVPPEQSLRKKFNSENENI